jgi:hypothetical protein
MERLGSISVGFMILPVGKECLLGIDGESVVTGTVTCSTVLLTRKHSS